MSSNLNLLWHAVYVKNRYEKKVSDALSKKDIENYCPYNNKLKSDKRKVQAEPLFACLVFVRMAPEQATTIKAISGVVNFAYWLGKPVVLKDEEINAIRSLTQTNHPLKVEKTGVKFSAMVKLLHKRAISREGKLVQIYHIPYKAEVPSLGYTISLDGILENENELTVSNEVEVANLASQPMLWKQLSKEVG